jgi:hypothetical protein
MLSDARIWIENPSQILEWSLNVTENHTKAGKSKRTYRTFDDNHSGAVPDLQQKIRWLIRDRGASKNKNGRMEPITNQKSLAEALGMTPVRLSRCINSGKFNDLGRIAPLIATLYRCDEVSFREDSFEDFKTKTLGLRVTWSALVRAAPPLGKVEAIRPVVHQGMGARGIVIEGAEDRSLPRLAPGTHLSVTFPTAIAGVSMHGWHLMAFSGDSTGYQNWIPYSEHLPQFAGLQQVPQHGTEIKFPANDRLRVAGDVNGEHDVVVLLSRDKWRPDLLAELKAKLSAHELAPKLDELARWVSLKLERGEAKVMRAVFFVTPNP